MPPIRGAAWGHWLVLVKELGFNGVRNVPPHCIVDDRFRDILEKTGMGVAPEVAVPALARMDLFTIVFVSSPAEACARANASSLERVAVKHSVAELNRRIRAIPGSRSRSHNGQIVALPASCV